MAGSDIQSDVLIVGGGTAGSVLAARLSEDAGRRVTLIEAGRDLPPDVPSDVADVFPRPAVIAVTAEPFIWRRTRRSAC